MAVTLREIDERNRAAVLRGSVEDVVATAEHEQLSYRGFLAELLLSECDDRRRRSARRVKGAGFPREKWLEDFDFDANPAINPATINTLAGGAWIKAGEPLCLIGDSGTGKSHLLIGLGTAAAQQGFRVRYTLATKLVNELAEPPTGVSSPRRSPATGASTCSASTSWATCSSTATAPNSYSTC